MELSARHEEYWRKNLKITAVLMLGIMALAVLYMGLYPAPFTDTMQTSVADLLKHVAVSKLPQ